jgi:hypothetical protein
MYKTLQLAVGRGADGADILDRQLGASTYEL